MLKMTEEDFEKVIKINLTGAFNMTQVVLKQMIKAREGAIINMSSGRFDGKYRTSQLCSF